MAGVRSRGHRAVIALEGPKELAPLVQSLVRAGDYVVCLGAGSITYWAQALPARLARLFLGAPQSGTAA